MNLNEIKRNVKNISKLGTQANELIQQTAVGILEHADGAGKGDVTQALALVNAMPASFRRERLVKWFLYFGGIGMNVDKNEVRLIKDTSARHPTKRGANAFDIDGAKVNLWHDERAAHLENEPPTRIPDTLIEFSDNVMKFCDRMDKYIDDDNRFINDKAKRKAAHAAIDAVREVGNRLTAGEKVERLTKELEEAQAAIAA